MIPKENTHPPQVYNPVSRLASTGWQKITSAANAIPLEAVALLVAAVAMRALNLFFWPSLAGMGIAVGCVKLVVKTIEWYDISLYVSLTKMACRFHQRHPNLQLALTICSVALSIVSRTLGFTAGVLLGGLGAVMLDVEKYKLIQKANRKKELL